MYAHQLAATRAAHLSLQDGPHPALPRPTRAGSASGNSIRAALEGGFAHDGFEGKLPIAPMRLESRLYERAVAVPYLPLNFASGFVSNVLDLKDTRLNGACTIALSIARAQRKERARQFEAASDDKPEPVHGFHLDSTLSWAQDAGRLNSTPEAVVMVSGNRLFAMVARPVWKCALDAVQRFAE